MAENPRHGVAVANLISPSCHLAVLPAGDTGNATACRTSISAFLFIFPLIFMVC
jgi:hypothetical protein